MRDNFKERHEESVAIDLLKTLGVDAKFLKHGNDTNEPDALFEQQGEILGIEVTATYYDNSHAEKEWKIVRGIIKPLPKTPITIWNRSDGDEKISQRTQQAIDDKCSKKYVGADLFWLCIEHRGYLTDYEATVNCVKALNVPANNRFDKILILYTASLNEGDGFRVLEVPVIPK